MQTILGSGGAIGITLAKELKNYTKHIRRWIQLAANELKVEAKIQKIPVWLIHILGLFIPVMKEFPVMIYQNEQDYFFDSSKFEKRFNVSATATKDGIRILIEYLKAQNVSR